MSNPTVDNTGQNTSLTPFHKVLIANRGEIAVRIIRAAKSGGYATVAVYSQADASAMHVSMADEAVCLGPSAPSESYLNIDAVIAAAKATGAHAIHPGYGFLAENPELPDACREAGIVFIGPSAAAIRAMGDKAGAKTLMIDTGIPCLPGYHDEDQDDAHLKEQADRIGWPLMIKAVSGGGGRGLRRVEKSEDFHEALKSARSEATTAFADGRVLLEKALLNPRHIEIQIMADRHGNAIHLGERDCSVQRRHQKMIEESPSPAVSPQLRNEMGAAAVRAALAIGYEGAGTLEFLLAEDGSWYFMEMNTRLQVEHAVTEAITGLDLVDMQLRIATGAPLDLQQADVQFTGHAIEVRLCAEDPVSGFLPQSGRIEFWQPSHFIRIDHALRSGTDISPHYDSLIAKLIAYGPDRKTACIGMLRGLADTVALGIRTNQAFLSSCLSHPEFISGGATTDFVSAHASQLLAHSVGQEANAASLVAAILRASPEVGLTHGFAAPIRLARDVTIYDFRVCAGPRGYCEVFDHAGISLRQISVQSIDDNGVQFTEATVRQRCYLWRNRDRIVIHTGGENWDFSDRSFSPGTSAGTRLSDGKIRASMTGRIVTVNVAVGDKVKSGQQVAVLEAMKMEHTHSSQLAGIVTAVNIAIGDQVDANSILVEIEAE